MRAPAISPLDLVGTIADRFGQEAAVAWDASGIIVPSGCAVCCVVPWSHVNLMGSWRPIKDSKTFRDNGMGCVLEMSSGDQNGWDRRHVLVRDDDDPLGCRWLEDP